MTLSGATQEALVCLLLFDNHKDGGKLVRSLVPAKYYDPFYAELAQAAMTYLDKYGKVPGEHAIDLLNVIVERRPKLRSQFKGVFKGIMAIRKGVNRQYIINQAQTFCRLQKIRSTVTQVMDLVEENPDETKINEAETLMVRCGQESNQLFDPGKTLHEHTQDPTFLNDDREAWPTGIKEIDEVKLGPARGRLGLFFASYGKGKSWWLCNLAKHAGLMNQKRVLYITLELSEEEVAQRMIQNLFSITKRKAAVRYMKFVQDEDGRFLDLEEKELLKRPYLKQRDAHSMIAAKGDWLRNRPEMRIKQFPTGSLTVRELNAYMDSLEVRHNFIPDLLLIDYPDLMEIDAANEKAETSKIYKDIRGIAIKKDIAVNAVSQANREGAKAKQVRGHHITADWSKMGTVDTAFTYSQTDNEHDRGFARLFVDKGRTDTDRFQIMITQAYSIGQFCMSSIRMNTGHYFDVLASSDEDAPGGEEDEEESAEPVKKKAAKKGKKVK